MVRSGPFFAGPRGPFLDYHKHEYLGIMRGSCTNWENGYSMPEEELIEDLAAYFRVPMKELNMVNPLTQEKSAPKMKIIVQSPVGEEINMTDLAAKLPEGTENLEPLYRQGSPVGYMAIAVMIMTVIRQVFRGVALYHVYGMRSVFFGSLLPPLLPFRLIYGNVRKRKSRETSRIYDEHY